MTVIKNWYPNWKRLKIFLLAVVNLKCRKLNIRNNIFYSMVMVLWSKSLIFLNFTTNDRQVLHDLFWPIYEFHISKILFWSPKHTSYLKYTRLDDAHKKCKYAHDERKWSFELWSRKANFKIFNYKIKNWSISHNLIWWR